MMNYRKGLQSLMMVVLLGGIGVLSAEAQESASNPALQNWKALQDQTATRYQAGDYVSAEQFARQALAIAERAFGPEHPDTAFSLKALALVLKAQDRYEEAESLDRRALAIREKELEAEHPDTTGRSSKARHLWEDLKEQGTACFHAGDYAGAERFARKALALAERTFGPEHPDTALSLNALALILLYQDRREEAEPLHRRALAIEEKVGSKAQQQWKDLQDQVAARYQAGDYAGAEQVAREVLMLAEHVFGPEYPDTARSLNNLAAVLQAQGRYGEAEPLYRRALAIQEKVLGAEHPDTATSLDNLAEVLRLQGRYGEAEPLVRRALAIREKVLGPEHPDTASSKG